MTLAELDYKKESKKRIGYPVSFQILNIQSELTQIFKQLAEDPSWAFENLTQKDTSYATHGFHKYPAKFIPQLAKRCIEENAKTGKN